MAQEKYTVVGTEENRPFYTETQTKVETKDQPDWKEEYLEVHGK